MKKLKNQNKSRKKSGKNPEKIQRQKYIFIILQLKKRMKNYENPEKNLEKSGNPDKKSGQKSGTCFRTDIQMIHEWICNETWDIEINGKNFQKNKT